MVSDGGQREEGIEVFGGRESKPDNLLDSRTVSGLPTGQYLTWRLRGHVRIRISRIAGPNAIVNGLFLPRTAAATRAPLVAALRI